MMESDRTNTLLSDPALAESTPRATGETPSAGPSHAEQPEEPLPRPFGRYELRSLLGAGGMGRVFLAHDPQLDRLVALKMPTPVSGVAGWRERFLSEARAAATLAHPNVCPVHEVGEVDGQPYLTMAFIEGETLAARLERGGRLEIGTAIELVRTVSRAMQEAHRRGIVHRDLKPANLMMDLSGRPVIMDFGLAIRSTATDDLRLTLTGVALGTPAYMPPEQAGGEHDSIGPAADVYSLGIILYKLLTGRVPFQAKSFGKLLAQIERDAPPRPSSLNPEIDPALEGIVLKALAKEPGDRFADAGGLADALDRYLAGDIESLSAQFAKPYRLPDIATGEYIPERGRTTMLAPRRRSRRGWLIGTLAFGLLAIIATVIYVKTDYGELEVRLSDPNAKVDVRVNDKEVTLNSADGKPIRIRAGANQKLEISSEDFETVSESFDLKRNGATIVQVTLKPKAPIAKGTPEKEKEAAKKSDIPVKKVPPPPEVYPKSPAKIELPGWEMLVDATREKMDEWLAERKTAKHSVMWLDAFMVTGKPVYAALAALDNREPNWRALTYVSAADMANRANLQKQVDLTANRLVSLASYVEAAGPRTVFLFHPGNSVWSLGPATTRSFLAKDVERNKDNGFSMRALRPFTFAGDHAYATVLEVQPGNLPPVFRNDLVASEFDAFLAEYQAKGYRASQAAAYPREDVLRFSAVMIADPQKAVSEVHRDLSPADLKAKWTELADRGYAPANIAGYPRDGKVSYVGVWVKQPPKPTEFPKTSTLIETPGWEILADADQKRMEGWLDERKKAGHSVMWLDAAQVADRPLYTAVASLDGRAAKWTAMLDLPVNEANTIATTSKGIDSKDNWLVSLSGFTRGDEIRNAMLWHHGARRWKISADASEGLIPGEVTDAAEKGAVMRVLRPFAAGEKRPRYSICFEVTLRGAAPYKVGLSRRMLIEFVDEQRKLGMLPRSIAAVSHDNSLHFTALCEPNKLGLEWEFAEGMTVAELKTKADDFAKRGFQPRFLSAYAWDGAVRYIGVWAKEAAKK